MSVELYNAEGPLGQFASNQGYSDLIAWAHEDYQELDNLFEKGSAEGPEVHKIFEALGVIIKRAPEDVASTAKELQRLIAGETLVFISNGTHDGDMTKAYGDNNWNSDPDDESEQDDHSEPDDENEDLDKADGDRWVTINGNRVLIGPDGNPKAGNPKAYGGEIRVSEAKPEDIAAMQKDVAHQKVSGRGSAALGILLMMSNRPTLGSGDDKVPLQNLIARDASGTFLGAMQGVRMSDGHFHVDELAVNPQIAMGKMKVNHVGTELMVNVARMADGHPVTLTSLDSTSDKFYQALGMKYGDGGKFTWTADQVKAVAAHGVTKMDNEFDVQTVLRAAKDVEDEFGPPLASKSRTQKADFEISGNIIKVDKVQHLVFGWFSVVQIDGQDLTDTQGDIISEDTLESAAYDFVLNARVAGDMHEHGTDGAVRGIGRLVESVIFTYAKQAAMRESLKAQGIDAVLDLRCIAWWGGFKVDNADVWDRITTGQLRAFSIGGRGKRDVIPT